MTEQTPENTQNADVRDQLSDNSRRNFLKAGSMLGLAAGFSPIAIAEAFTDSKFSAAEPHELITDKETIRPFKVNFSDAELAELRKRINATKWPERETVSDRSQGVQLATMQKLARYWGTDYNWRKGEAKLKAVPHFITEIDGLDIHFIHVRSKHEMRCQ
jgi:hypothetical protein